MKIKGKLEQRRIIVNCHSVKEREYVEKIIIKGLSDYRLNKPSKNMDTKKKMQELHDSYKSPEARKAVEYIWDAYTEDYLIERIMEIMKDIADDSEYLATKNL